MANLILLVTVVLGLHAALVSGDFSVELSWGPDNCCPWDLDLHDLIVTGNGDEVTVFHGNPMSGTVTLIHDVTSGGQSGPEVLVFTGVDSNTHLIYVENYSEEDRISGCADVTFTLPNGLPITVKAANAADARFWKVACLYLTPGSVSATILNEFSDEEPTSDVCDI